MRLKTCVALFAAVALSPITAFSQETTKVNPSSSLQQKSEKGWFFYEEPVKPKEEKPVAQKSAPPQAPTKPKREDDDCLKADTWTAECGFIDPGKDVKFQARQRDALLNNMALSKNDPKAVEQFQYYMKFVMDRASEVANNWYYNLVQNPELDAQANAPISTFGLDLMSKVKSSKQKDLFNAIKNENAIFIYFTRSDCVFCHQMAPIVQRAAKEIGIPVYNAALDNQCIPGMEQGCLSGEAVTEPAMKLQVSIVPTVFLYIPKKTFIRVSSGVVDSSTMLQRVSTFFNAYRTALLKGLNNSVNGISPSVDFSQNDAKGTAAGVVTPKPVRQLQESSSNKDDVPNETISKEVQRMLLE